MLENLYAPKMSASIKTLLNRFTRTQKRSKRLSKVAAAVISCIAVLTMLGVGSVLAKESSDGLEHWDKNEIFYKDGVMFSINVSGKNVPDWVYEDLAGADGKIDITIHRYQCRTLIGYITDSALIVLTGEKGTIKLSDMGCCSRARSLEGDINPPEFALQYPYFSAISGSEHSDIYTPKEVPIMALTDEKTLKNKCVSIYFAFDDNKELQTAFAVFGIADNSNEGIRGTMDFNGMQAETDLSYIGNFLEDFTEDAWFKNPETARYFSKYFSMYENLYQNKTADGIHFDIEKATTDGIVVNTDITLWQAARVVIEVYNKDGRCISTNEKEELDVHKKQYVLTPIMMGVYDYTSVYKHPQLIYEIPIPENQFVSGEKYRVCIAILDVYRQFDVLYRWQEYVTMS